MDPNFRPQPQLFNSPGLPRDKPGGGLSIDMIIGGSKSVVRPDRGKPEWRGLKAPQPVFRSFFLLGWGVDLSISDTSIVVF